MEPITSDINIVVQIYGYEEKIINNCIDIVSNTMNMSHDEIMNVILDEELVNEYLRSSSGPSSGNDDFVYKGYDVNIDDQKMADVPYEKQEYINRDFTKLVLRRFPKFDENSDTKAFKWEQFWNIQRNINDTLLRGRNYNWTNQTLSYTRDSVIAKHMVNCIVKPLYNSGLFNSSLRPSGMTIVDATANTGGDSITFGLEKFVNKVISYEIVRGVYDMMVRNVNLYRLQNKIITKNKKFDYDIPQGSLVVIDPPYESAYNSEIFSSQPTDKNFNISIDATPIYNVAQKCLDRGAKCVMLTLPKNFKYNQKFAIDHSQHVEVYQMGKKNNKIFIVMNLKDVPTGRVNFKFYRVVQSGAKNKQGKVNPYKCKIEN